MNDLPRPISVASTTLPDFLGIGAQRSGTTWLDRQLRLHPDILMPSDRKECHYFDRHPDRGSDWYAALFASPANHPGSPPLVRGEITPKYLFDPEVPARIHALLPEVKLIAILRNPADRAWSHYGHTRRNDAYTGSFEEFLAVNEQAFTRGLYAEQLERYLALFGRERLKVMLFEQVVAGPQRAVEDLCGFLGVDPSRMGQEVSSEKRNESYLPRHAGAYRSATAVVQWLRRNDLYWVFNLAKRAGFDRRMFGRRAAHGRIDPAVREALTARYEPDMQRLEALLGLDLDLWRRPVVADVPPSADERTGG